MKCKRCGEKEAAVCVSCVNEIAEDGRTCAYLFEAFRQQCTLNRGSALKAHPGVCTIEGKDCSLKICPRVKDACL